MPKGERVYNYLLTEYGRRKCWLSDLSEHFQISYYEANVLTLALGFKRGKCLTPKPLADFLKAPGVERVLSHIS